MKNFLLFYGNEYYPQGGFIDFEKDFDTFLEAVDFYEKKEASNEYGWAHIYNLKEKRIEKCCHSGEWRLLCCSCD